MQKLKSLFLAIFSLLFATLLLVFFSLQGEKNYQENCENLSIECKPGNIQRAAEFVFDWAESSITSLKDKWDGSEQSNKQEKSLENF